MVVVGLWFGLVLRCVAITYDLTVNVIVLTHCVSHEHHSHISCLLAHAEHAHRRPQQVLACRRFHERSCRSQARLS
jgi:hypothetical protein